MFRTFGFDDACETVHFQKTRLLFNKVENDICVAMVRRIKSNRFISYFN
jgi:hypothetical protein